MNNGLREIQNESAEVDKAGEVSEEQGLEGDQIRMEVSYEAFLAVTMPELAKAIDELKGIKKGVKLIVTVGVFKNSFYRNAFFEALEDFVVTSYTTVRNDDQWTIEIKECGKK
jgi:hypothetical protein